MYKILRKEVLAPQINLMEIDAPFVARKGQPGQFIILRMREYSERIPLTIADFDRGKGTVTIVFQEVGKSTEELATLNAGDVIADFVGPLGIPSDHGRKEDKKVICVSGGVGTAVIFPELRKIKENGNYTITIQGSRSKELLFWSDRLEKYSDEFYITTDDGSFGRKGFVTDQLKDILAEKSDDIAYVLAIGPIPMMKFVCALTEQYSVKTYVSLNTIMVDGTGMCGSCRITVGNETKFACVDGPEFDGHLVDWKEMEDRNSRFIPQERESLERYRRLMGK